MKRILTALALILTFGVSARAMSVDDIIELCKAGFEPDRIASIVEATGLDEPLEAQDWVTLKEQGCDEELVDALLAVLVPVEEDAEDYTGEYGEGFHRAGNADVNVYLGGGYWNRWNDWWYGGFSIGWYDPYWSIGWTYWDPYWYSTWWGYRPYTYHYAWWGHPWYRYCQPTYYCYSCYDYGWTGHHGSYARYKSERRGSLKSDNYSYAGAKTRTTVESGVMSKVRAKSTFASATMGADGGLKSKSTSSGVYKSKTASGQTKTTYTTRKTTTEAGVGQTKSGTSGGSSVTTRPKSTTTKTKGTYTPPSTGTTTKTPSGTTTTKKSDDGNTTKTPSVTTPKSPEPSNPPSTTGSSKGRPKGKSQSSLSRSHGGVQYTTARQARETRAAYSHARSYSSAKKSVQRPASASWSRTNAKSTPSYSSGSVSPKSGSYRSSSPAPSRSVGAPSAGHGKSVSASAGRAVARPK
ncbi:MAG: hypothetical protein AB1752_00495 [Candidatus Zixiibacteriota bacterium]